MLFLSCSLTTSNNASSPLRNEQPSQAGQQNYHRKNHSNTLPTNQLAIVPTVAVHQRTEHVLSAVLASIAQLGGNASEDVPFMETGIDSLGKCLSVVE